MAGSRALKNRIKSTKNIRQMTRAMEAVSAVKMRRSQMAALAARPYALSALAILHKIQKSTEEAVVLSPLTQKRKVKTLGLVVITSDKGLAGSFNMNVIKKAEKLIAQSNQPAATHAAQAGRKTLVVAVGKKGRDYFKRRKINVEHEFLGAGDFGAINETRVISNLVAKLFIEKKCDEVVLIYTNFLSALKQEVVVRKLLPFTEEALAEIIADVDPLRGRYANMPSVIETTNNESMEGLVFEPSPTEALGKILPQLLAVQIFHAILEGNASEHSSRMIAMKNASDSAGELVDTLNIQYNKARQAAITKELTEITAGSEALKT